jgi:hypothetical protein
MGEAQLGRVRFMQLGRAAGAGRLGSAGVGAGHLHGNCLVHQPADAAGANLQLSGKKRR